MRTIVLLAVLLAGCAAPRIVASTQATVIIADADDQAVALALASTHCERYGTVARYAGPVPGYLGIQIAYDCVR